MRHSRGFSHTLLMVLACLVPLFLYFMLVGMGVYINPLFFLLFLVICCTAMFYFMRGAPLQEEQLEEEDIPEGDMPPYLTLAYKATDVFQPRRQYRAGQNLVIEGKLLADPDTAYKALKERFANTDVTPLLQEDDAGRSILVLTTGALERKHLAETKTESFPWLNVVLFGLTILTTTWAGAAHQGVDLLAQPGQFMVGLPYALGLMLILGAHELGHYFAALAHKMKVTLPYFVPVPFALGTFGAFIQMKSPSENRRALFDVGVAGPLAGLVFAIPALLIGLQYSTIIPQGGTETSNFMHGGGASVDSSFLFAMLAKFALGEALQEGHQLILHPLAFAGWLGLLVTALNLLPIGQLDGGHIAHALFGRRKSDTIGSVALFALILLGLFVWSGLLFWAIIVYFIAGTKSRSFGTLNDLSQLDARRVAIGAFAFVLLFLILTPVPHAFFQSLGIHCPYI